MNNDISRSKSADAASGKPGRDQIAELAHSYWEAEGHPQGRDQEFWFRAEAALASGDAAGSSQEKDG